MPPEPPDERDELCAGRPRVLVRRRPSRVVPHPRDLQPRHVARDGAAVLCPADVPEHGAARRNGVRDHRRGLRLRDRHLRLLLVLDPVHPADDVALLGRRRDVPDVAAEPRQPVHGLGHLQLRKLRRRRGRRVHGRRLGVAPDGLPRLSSGGELRQTYMIVIGGVNGV